MKNTPLKILLADDDFDDCNFFKLALEALPLTTKLSIVNDGEQLMAYLDKNAQQLPDVLFLDLNMPRKNGFECLSEIKLNASLKILPVVIFSTSYEHEVINLLYQNGAKYFMRKPAEFSQLKNIIQHTVQLIMQENITQPTKENFVLTVQNNL
ncbi:MAG: CheY-like chemotaxis protein [Saprospiraceae bacterium]